MNIRHSITTMSVVLFFAVQFAYSSSLVNISWLDSSKWTVVVDNGSTLSLSIDSTTIPSEKCLALHYRIPVNGGWVHAEIPFSDTLYGQKTDSLPISLWIKSTSMKDTVQLKILTQNDSTVLRGGIILGWNFSNWKKITIYRRNMPDGWGGNSSGHPIRFGVAVMGADTNSLLIRSLVIDSAHTFSTFEPNSVPQLDYNARTAPSANQLDTLVIKWLEQIQDGISTGGKLLPAMEDNNLQTYTNALSAMTFIVAKKPERAERILSFYDALMDSSIHNSKYPSFYKNGKAAGLFQSLEYRQSDSTYIGNSDRWIGDMAWLLLAYKCYQKYCDSSKYTTAITNLKNLLLEFYKSDSQSGGGFIKIGWQKNDSFFDSTGHIEGNIDCYAALKLCGENETAIKIKKWLDSKWGNGFDHPLDEYTWRVLSFGADSINSIRIPESDYRFWKLNIDFNGKKVDGIYSYPLLCVDNIFIEGVAHLACSYYMSGNIPRANYYSNLLDQFILPKDAIKYLPYVANNSNSDFSWVNINKGMASTAAWYIFAKSKFNPMLIEQYQQTSVNNFYNQALTTVSKHHYRQPSLFLGSHNVSFTIKSSKLNLKELSKCTIYDVQGRLIDRSYIINKNGRISIFGNKNKSISKNMLMLIKTE
jgi:hypothetical protein